MIAALIKKKKNKKKKQKKTHTIQMLNWMKEMMKIDVVTEGSTITVHLLVICYVHTDAHNEKILSLNKNRTAERRIEHYYYFFPLLKNKHRKISSLFSFSCKKNWFRIYLVSFSEKVTSPL